MKHISSHIKRAAVRVRQTERGELMRFFCGELNASRRADGLPLINMARMGKTLEGVPTKDLYYLKRVCNDARNFSKKFWWEIDPKRHEGEGGKKE